ncbi:MAG: prepilin-type N-terminal cleavage/methylation domain-containing protein, partial [Fibrobacter sp.]|nr:prepilin-type N-terminal cleavage/methylation domain-containing protein [Fibrobacter sp.]
MRKGFTLVEIMVVVVILGVLAGVGVPKLFGVIAKARASEVPVAAGTYVSLQNAYLHENNGIGSWKNIGYGAPGDGQTEYFEYSGCINGTIVFDQMEPDMPGWQATSRAGLNSCVTGSAWAVVIDPAGEREIDYRKIISSPECAMLTSTWGVVGETVEGMCETTGELHVAGTENKTPE